MNKNTTLEGKLPGAAANSVAFEPTVSIGLDVHKKTIYLAALLGKTWLLEKVFDTQDLGKLQKALKALAKHGSLRACYEASGAGFQLHRLLTEWGIPCEVIAPSLIPVRPGEKKKCDRLDARKLAEYFASGLLTSVRIPSPKEEADRDLVRCRFSFRKDVTKTKHRVVKFLARKDRVYFSTAWTEMHRGWLDEQTFEIKSDELTYRHYLDQLRSLEAKLAEIDSEILELSKCEPYRDQVRVLRGFRGVDTLTAMVFLTELGDLNRFAAPRQLMAYLGLTPSVHQSGDTRRDGSITKAGNSHIRHVLVQATWNYFGAVKVGKLLQHRQKDLPAWAVELSSKAQKRLNKRLGHLAITRGKCVAVVAGARELACFLAGALRTLSEHEATGISLPQPEIELSKGGRPPKASTPKSTAPGSGSRRSSLRIATPALSSDQ